MSNKRVQAIVSGHVQGVGYRYFAAHVAERLGVVGTVRNVADGAVEAVAEGDEQALRSFVTELHRGPSAAQVAEVQEAWGEPVGGFSHFEAIS